MKPSRVVNRLLKAFKSRRTVILVGPPGCAKTSLIKKAASIAGAKLIISHPVTDEPTDYKGLPFPEKGGKRAKFLPFGNLAEILEVSEKDGLVVWFLDDLGQSAEAVQAAIMQLLLARELNGQKLPDNVVIVAATNRRVDKAGVKGLLSTVISRFSEKIDVDVDLDDWTLWAYDAGIRPEVIGFHRLRGHQKDKNQLLYAFDPKTVGDMEMFPSLRAWENASIVLDEGVDPQDELEVFTGVVGKIAASEFVGFLRDFRDLPNPDAVILDPDQAVIPDKPSARYAIATALAARTSTGNFGRIVRYAERLYKNRYGDIGVFLVRECQHKCPEVQTTGDFAKLCASDFGKLFAA